MPATSLDAPRAGADADADTCWHALVESASAGYRGSDGHALRFARAKLGGDRVFRHLLERGLIAPGARVVDMGCGQGLLASLLQAAGAASAAGRWPAGWGAAPAGARVTGVDLLPLDLERAAAALGEAATFRHADMRRFELPPCDAVVFLDTLHYLAPSEQDAVLARAAAALRPGGVLLLRVADASSPLRHALGRCIDRCTMLLHGGGFGRLAGRPLAGWRSTLEALGLRVEWRPMNGRPPFANLLIVARRPAAPSAASAGAAGDAGTAAYAAARGAGAAGAAALPAGHAGERRTGPQPARSCGAARRGGPA